MITEVNAFTLSTLLQKRGILEKEKEAYVFLPDGETAEEKLTYGNLYDRARQIGGLLQEEGNKGDRVILLFQPGLDYIAAFFGCLYGGMIAVPSYPPKSNHHGDRIESIIKDARASIVLTNSALYSQINRSINSQEYLKALKWINMDEIDPAWTGNWSMPKQHSDDIAFLQYTSGSTALPKGVMVSHGNLVHNLEIIRKKFEHTQHSKVVSWLPPFHDMGLIGGILQPFYAGFPAVLMPAFAFLQKPVRWLKAITRCRATSSGGPNFAYEHCVRNIPEAEKEGLDLSSWDVAFNGAEPVKAGTLENFSRAFASCGFRAEAFYPCYGLAEATLFVTGGEKKSLYHTIKISKESLEILNADISAGNGNSELVSSGSCDTTDKLLIVDPHTLLPAGENRVGEIWFAGDSMARGYWNRQAETAESFRAYPADSDDGPFLRTGDLGFINGNRLFVTGRIKDLIIIRGRNYYPHDLELCAEKSHYALQPGSGAAFAVDEDGEEKLYIAYEVRHNYRDTDPAEIACAARKALSEEYNVLLHGFILLRTMSIPKTSSGKIQRKLCREKYLNGALKVLGRNIINNEAAAAPSVHPAPGSNFVPANPDIISTPAEAEKRITRCLLKEAAAVLNRESFGLAPDKPLTSYGLDSLMAVNLGHRIENLFGIQLSLDKILEGKSLMELASEINRAGKFPETAGTGKRAPDATPGPFPLSPEQQGIWFLDQLVKDSAVHNLSCALRISAQVNTAVFRETVIEIVRRHSILRSLYKRQEAGPVMIIHSAPDPDFPFLFDDTGSFSAGQLKQNALRPFDLEKEYPLRLYLYKTGKAEFVFQIVVHHIAADFRSLALLAEELGSIYHALLSGTAALPPRPAAAYPDFVEAQKNIIRNRPELWEFWKRNLGGELPVLNLPADFPRPPVINFEGASVFRKLDRNMLEQLRALGQEHNSTMYMILLSLFYLLLSRYTGQEDIIIGSPAEGRTGAAFARIMGCFINPLVLRIHEAGNPGFPDFLQGVKQVTLSALAHREYPFGLLVERLKQQREISRAALFQAMFIHQKAFAPGLEHLTPLALNEEQGQGELAGLPFTSLPLGNHTCQYDITLVTAEQADGLGISFQYNKRLFKQTSAARMLDNYVMLLQGILNNPGLHIRALPFPAEKETLLYTWNRTCSQYPGTCIHSLVEETAAGHEDRIALISGEQSFTYGRLNKRANQLAHYLKKQGFSRGDTAALFLDRSAEIVICLLAILKAGGCYLPLDPVYPRARISFILKDAEQGSGNLVVITKSALAGSLPQHPGPVIFLDREEPDICLEKDTNPDIPANPDDPAYIIYTSGSTGNPKGVIIQHRAVINFLLSMRKKPGLQKEDRLLSVTTIAFDIAVLEIFLPLVTGACIVMADRTQVADGRLLAAAIARHNITVMQGTPAVFKILLAAGFPGHPSLKLLCGGEAFPRTLAAELLPNVKEVWNMYGPTETTVWSALHRIESEEDAAIIGRPVDNTRIYLLDKKGQPVPLGAAGEVYIGGDGVAAGYFRQTELTNRKFLPDPFRKDTQGGRMYRTGDLARYDDKGRLIFLGRSDFQVKIRGFRIETGEIESVITKHRAIREAVVVVSEAVPGDKQLVAYCLPAGRQQPVLEELRDFMKEWLPVYMLPAHFVFLDTFPRTPNGKIDRKALPAPARSGNTPTSEYALPVNNLQAQLAEIWKEALGTAEVGIHDNFFTLGGHSVLMAQIQSKIGKMIPGRDVSIVELFQYPTIHSLAEYLDHSGTINDKTAQETEKTETRLKRRNPAARAGNTRRNIRHNNENA